MARQPNTHDSRYGVSAIVSVIMAFVGWGMLVLTEAYSWYIENVGALMGSSVDIPAWVQSIGTIIMMVGLLIIANGKTVLLVKTILSLAILTVCVLLTTAAISLLPA